MKLLLLEYGVLLLANVCKKYFNFNFWISLANNMTEHGHKKKLNLCVNFAGLAHSWRTPFCYDPWSEQSENMIGVHVWN